MVNERGGGGKKAQARVCVGVIFKRPILLLTCLELYDSLSLSRFTSRALAFALN